MDTATLPGALRVAATRFGLGTAIMDGPTTLTYGDLLDQVHAVARGYVALGLQPQERVAVWAPNSWQWQVAALAVSYAGATLVPVNTRYTGHEVLDIVTRTSARLLVVEDGFLGRSQVAELQSAAAEVGTGLPTVVRLSEWGRLVSVGAEVPAAVVEDRADAVTPDDVADILFTAGTTGRSKGACSAHRQTISVAETWGSVGELTGTDRYLIVNPFFHSFGYKAGIVACLLRGTMVVPMAVFDVDTLLATVEDHRITVLPGAPTIFQSMLDAPGRSGRDLSSLRLAVTGATTVPVALVERMQRELSFDTVLTAFGMTECVVATMCRAGDPPEVVANTCGQVVPGLELAIADPQTGERRPAGEDGELLLRGPNVMLGYLDDPQATAAAIGADGWLHTGDVAKVDDAGNLTITDRLKDMYISGGFNVYPAEVEQTLARLDGVADAAVVGVADERLGEVGKAFVVRRAGAELSAGDVVAYCRQRLANFKVPRTVEFVAALPRNASGKVLKNDLAAGGSLWTSS